jgi:chemotaxis signal transduction protein
MDVLLLEVSGKQMGIAARHVYRIVDDAAPAPVPLLPPCHMGILYYRGDLFDVIDLCQLLGGQDSGPCEKSPYVILLKWGQRKLGLLPDRIAGIRPIADADGDTVFTQDGQAIRLITPEDIWQRLSELPYGHG